MATSCAIELKNITKAFGDTVVLENFNLKINEGEFVTLLGPSGCGKTTTLRLIGGFESPDEGEIFFDGQKINDVPPNKRPVNTVFQKYSLFTHMNIFENVAFGLKIKKMDKKIIAEKVKSALDMVKKAVANKIGKFTKMDIVAMCPSLSNSSVESSLKKLAKKATFDIGSRVTEQGETLSSLSKKDRLKQLF